MKVFIKRRYKYLQKVIYRSYFTALVLGTIFGVISVIGFEIKGELIFMGIGSIVVLSIISGFSIIQHPFLVWVIVGIGLGIVYTTYFNFINIGQADLFEGESVEREFVVMYPPESSAGKQKVYLFSKDIGKVLTYLPIYPEFKRGDLLLIKGLLVKPKDFSDFSYINYLRSEKVFLIMEDAISLEYRGSQNQISTKIAEFVSGVFNRAFPEPHSSLMNGLILGTRSNMPEEFSNSLSATGTTHIIAVSGYNVSIVIIYILKLAGIVPKKLMTPILYGGLFLFISIVGINNIPALRATIMGLLVIFAKTCGRRGSFANLMLLTVLILIVNNPYVLLSLSFQLSFVATCGVVLFSHIIIERLTLIPISFREDLGVTLSAIIWTSPITVGSFGTFSLIAPLVNMIVLPFIPIIMLLGFVLIGIAFLGIDVFVLDYIIWLLLNFVIKVIEFFGSLPFGYINGIEWDPRYTFVAYFVMLLCLFEVGYRNFNQKMCTKTKEML